MKTLDSCIQCRCRDRLYCGKHGLDIVEAILNCTAEDKAKHVARMTDNKLTRYRLRKNTTVWINYHAEIDIGDLLYLDGQGDNLGRLYRCYNMTCDGIHRYRRVKPPFLYFFPTYDYVNGVLYWFDAGKYKDSSPFIPLQEGGYNEKHDV